MAPFRRVGSGGAIALHDLGGGGTPALLVHAAGFLGEVMRPLALALGDGLSCFAPDLRGHGCSEAPSDGDFSWDGLARDVTTAADAVARMTDDSSGADRAVTDRACGTTSAARSSSKGASPPSLLGFGHSVGGTALLLAEAAHPGTFAALYLYEPVLLLPSQRRDVDAESPLAQAARRRRETFASRAEAAARYAERPPLSQLHRDVLAAYVAHGLEDLADGTVRLACRPQNEALVFAYGFACDALDRIGKVACPVTLACGTESAYPGMAGLHEAVRLLSDTRLVELAGLGHLGPLESPRDVARSVREAFGTARE